MADEAAALAQNVIAQANVNFTFDLYQVLAQEPGNLFFSPLSIQVILALIFLGARGDTAKQIAKGLHLPDEKDVVETGFHGIMHQLQESSNIVLDIANKVYLKPGFTIKEEFNASAVKFLAGLEEVDFAQEEIARKIINTWVEEKTNDKIKDLIPNGFLDERTMMVLVNAIYFKGEWKKKFSNTRTRPMRFFVSPESAKTVDMMTMLSHYMYAEISDLKSEAVLIPYTGKRFSMMIILPQEVNGLSNLEKTLSNMNLLNIVQKMTNREVLIYIPKFKLEFEKELKETLAKLGITSMFDVSAADLSGISDAPLEVSKALHKAYIEVNEEGTEAAAATALLAEKIQLSEAQEPPPVLFKADHPFLFFLLDQEAGTIAFAGRIAHPPGSTLADVAPPTPSFLERLFVRGSVPVAGHISDPARYFQS